MDDVVWSIRVEIGSPNQSAEHSIDGAGSGCGRLPHQDGVRMTWPLALGNAAKARLSLIVAVPERGEGRVSVRY
jgi:hypothetical protein